MGASEVQFEKTRLLHLRNVKNPAHPQFSAQRAPEDLNTSGPKGVHPRRQGVNSQAPETT